MKIHFSIEYRTQWGEDVRVQLKQTSADGTCNTEEYPLQTCDGRTWEGEITVEGAGIDHFEYKYALYRDSALVWTEWDVAPHTLPVDTASTRYRVDDLWRAIPDDLPLFSSAYTDCVAAHKPSANEPPAECTLQLHVVEPRLRKGQQLAITGSVPALGCWNTPVPMHLIGLQEWAANVDGAAIEAGIEYKYVITDEKGTILQWENGENRRIAATNIAPQCAWIKTDSLPRFDLGRWKCAGVVLPVFSIRTEKSCGVGDFGDLKTLIAWAASTGMRTVQILPINDTTITHTWTDSYPYNSISIYAFHPQYCDLAQVGALADENKMAEFEAKRQALNALPQIDYEAVNQCKRDYLRQIFKQKGAKVLASKSFKSFYKSNEYWLMPYAAFSYLRDKYGTPVFGTWPKFNIYSRTEIEALCAPKSEAYPEISLHYYIQYQLHLQLLAVREFAHSKGVILKGDIPIGISRNSVEAWTEPFYFNLNGQAGAPPDDFSTNGQNWGFPTYNWDVMAQDGYQWWLRRFTKMAEYFDAYRIDHVLGFFRIWEIPLDAVHGLLGQFSPAMPMSLDEIESYGLHFDRERMTHPLITDEILGQRFGAEAEVVKAQYLDKQENGLYKMKSDFDTQRKVEAAFAGKTDKTDTDLRDKLYALISNVLFVVDRKNPAMYHPRISVQLDAFYQSMSETDRNAFNQLYNDYFYRRHNQFWYREAMQKLPRLTQATRMLVCAEDLGMVPDCVPWVMNQLRMLSLEIQTMPKDPRYEFGHLDENPYRSVCTISTHDMATLRGWWEEDEARTQRFYNLALQRDGKAPATLPGWLAEDVLNQHLSCPSMLCLLSLQDWLAMDETLRCPDAQAERINVPATPRHYWRYRMHLTVEQLMAANDFNQKVHTLITRAGRDEG